MEYGNFSLFPPISPTQHSDISTAATSLAEESETLKKKNSLLLSEIAHLKSICNRDITLFILQNSRGTSLADVDRSIHNVSPCSSTEDVAKESSTSPPKLFGVPLY